MGNSMNYVRSFWRNYNALNRALRHIDKEKVTPIPKNAKNYPEKASAAVADGLSESFLKKDDALDERLKQIYVTQNQVIPEAQTQDKPLPQSRAMPPLSLYGFGDVDPTGVPDGKLSYQQLMEILEKISSGSNDISLNHLADQYKVDTEDLRKAVTHFCLIRLETAPKSSSGVSALTVGLPVIKYDDARSTIKNMFSKGEENEGKKQS